ncbi:MAG: hypothetical protein ACJA2H_001005 [Nitriliruptoraceae bacterium]
MNCSNCHTSAPDGARFCISCGSEIVEMTTELDPEATGLIRPVVIAPPAAVDLISCPACHARNSRGRVLCARCGIDLLTGAGTPPAQPFELHQPGPAVDVIGDVDLRDIPDRSRTAGIMASIVIVGAVVGVGVGILIANRGDDPSVDVAVFDAQIYTGDPTDLLVTGVGASSVRPDAGDVSYARDNLVDGDVLTAWSHDPAAEDATEIDLAFVVSDPAWITGIVIANGAQSGDLDFAADGRVLRLQLLVDGEAAVELQLLDEPGFQLVTLPEPLLLEEIRLTVTEAVSGDTYAEVSLSEVRFRGYLAFGPDLARFEAP